MKSVIVRPPFCRSVDAVFFCVLCAHESAHWSSKCYIRRPYSYLLHSSVGFLLLSSLLCSAGAAVGGSGLEVGFEANCRCLAVTDRYTGAILPLGTGLLTVFLNREVTVLPGLTSYSLLWEIIWD